MSGGTFTEGVVTFIAGAALSARQRVIVKAATATDPVEVDVAGSGVTHIGITEHAAASGDLVAVRMRNHNGTQLGTAAEAFARGATLYGGASGKIQDTLAGTAIGIALEAAAADGDIVEFFETT